MFGQIVCTNSANRDQSAPIRIYTVAILSVHSCGLAMTGPVVLAAGMGPSLLVIFRSPLYWSYHLFFSCCCFTSTVNS